MTYPLSTAFKGWTVARRDTYGPQYREIIATLVERRRAVGMSQVDLAKAAGTDQPQISKIERFERRLDLIDYVRVCRALGVDPGEPLRGIMF
jgi:transcriptional regulator with XRE-family HTH domain